MAIIESVDGDWEGLQTYAVAKLGKKIHEYNRAPPDEKITPYVSESDADAVIKDGEKKFGEAQKDLVRFSKILLAIRYNSGLLTDNQFFSILKSWKNYVPMARVFDENEEYHGFDDLKRREDHTDDTYSPLHLRAVVVGFVVGTVEEADSAFNHGDFVAVGVHFGRI